MAADADLEKTLRVSGHVEYERFMPDCAHNMPKSLEFTRRKSGKVRRRTVKSVELKKQLNTYYVTAQQWRRLESESGLRQ